jgi:gamma-glutamyltranspeptidase/glutathione hydrolase
MLITALAIIFIIVVALVLSSYLIRRKYNNLLKKTFSQAAEPIKRRGAVVIAYHPEAREIGEAIMRSGGNAFDAFIATVAAENVLAEGASSLAGSLSVLTYHAADATVQYLDADYNDPHAPAGDAAANKNLGRAMLVPGAPAGLEALATRYGSMPFSELLEPALELAQNGFHVNRLMEAAIRQCDATLNRTSYGRETFFRNGKAPQKGEMFYQPEVATFLHQLGKEGAAYVYTGEWGNRFLETVQSQGGVLTEKDLSEYRVRWCEPFRSTYRGHTIYSSSGNSFNGIWVLLALKTVEHLDLPKTPYYWDDADTLETLIRISHQVWSEPTIFNYLALNDRERIEAILTPEHTRSILQKARDRMPLNFMGLGGTHSYQIITVDAAGNIANGTTTINAGPWGDGIFVEGIPITNAGRIPWNTKPGERRLSPFSSHLVQKDEKPRFGVGSIGNSVPEASFQLLLKLIDYDLPVVDAVATPRFGTFPDSSSSRKISVKLDRNWLDPRIDEAIVKTLKKRGLKFQQKGLVETGLGAAIRFEDDESATGLTAPVPYLTNPFGY